MFRCGRITPPPSCPRLLRASTSFGLSFSEQGVDGRDIRAFTPVFDGLLPGHDSGEMVQRDRNPLQRMLRRINAPRVHGPISDSRRTSDQLARMLQVSVPNLKCHEGLETI